MNASASRIVAKACSVVSLPWCKRTTTYDNSAPATRTTRPAVELMCPPSFSLGCSSRFIPSFSRLVLTSSAAERNAVKLLPFDSPECCMILSPCDAHRSPGHVPFAPDPRQLGLQRELLEQRLHALQSGIALDRDMKRLALERFVPGVKEGDGRSRRAEVAPGGLNDVALPPGFLGSRARNGASLAERHGPWPPRVGFGRPGRFRRRHVT